MHSPLPDSAFSAHSDEFFRPSRRLVAVRREPEIAKKTGQLCPLTHALYVKIISSPPGHAADRRRCTGHVSKRPFDELPASCRLQPPGRLKTATGRLPHARRARAHNFPARVKRDGRGRWPSLRPQEKNPALCTQFASTISAGDTYPMLDPMPLSTFGPYWFSNFAAVALLGTYAGIEDVYALGEEADWERLCLGTFYIKSNYPGRSGHVCNGGFVTAEASRGRGVGREMGRTYLEWAPKLVSFHFFFRFLFSAGYGLIICFWGIGRGLGLTAGD